jgi:uncharacterized membrane protein
MTTEALKEEREGLETAITSISVELLDLLKPGDDWRSRAQAALRVKRHRLKQVERELAGRRRADAARRTALQGNKAYEWARAFVWQARQDLPGDLFDKIVRAVELHMTAPAAPKENVDA